MENIGTQLGDFLEGKSKPTILFEFTYTNIAVMALAIILVVVSSHLLIKAIG
jgi:hypothetical protein